MQDKKLGEVGKEQPTAPSRKGGEAHAVDSPEEVQHGKPNEAQDWRHTCSFRPCLEPRACFYFCTEHHELFCKAEAT